MCRQAVRTLTNEIKCGELVSRMCDLGVHVSLQGTGRLHNRLTASGVIRSSDLYRHGARN